jgi:nephrocystin-3
MSWFDIPFRGLRKQSALQSVATQRNQQKPTVSERDNRSVRVFVSSTFLDMQKERQVLVNEVFPALRAKYRARGVEIFEVDLRWGITRDMQERGDTLPTLLAEIDSCRPYFIGLLGDRFGWVPPQALTDSLRVDYPAIAIAEGMSVTGMEILHALSNIDTAARALLFDRDPSWDWTGTLNEDDRAAVTADSDIARAKLDELKVLIRQKVPVEGYSRPEEIRQKVTDALDALLQARFPERDAPDPFERTARLHQAYARERLGLHVGADRYLRDLDRWAEAGTSQPILITGASGGGKSALIANWLQSWREAHPSDIVFEHYLGASPDSADPMLLMRRLWEHLNRTTGEAVDQLGANAQLMDVSTRLAQRLAQASVAEGRVILALDGLDKLASEPTLRWLPLVPGVHMLASSLDGRAKDAALNYGFKPFALRLLTEAEQTEFIEGTLARWRRRLETEFVAGIVNPAATNLAGLPLYLKTVLNELRVSAAHARLSERLEIYRTAADMRDLFDHVLTRVEEDCGPDFVSKALPIIWAGRAGLEESEIIAIAGATPLAWAILRNGLGDGLFNLAERVTFSHGYLRSAVETRYLGNEDVRNALHIQVADHFAAQGLNTRSAEEIPFQLTSASAWERLELFLTDLEAFRLLYVPDMSLEMRQYWGALRSKGCDPDVLLCGSFFASKGKNLSAWHPTDIELGAAIVDFLSFIRGQGEQSLDLARAVVVALANMVGKENPATLTAFTNMAAALAGQDKLEEAQDAQEIALGISIAMFSADSDAALVAMNNLAATFFKRGAKSRALELQRVAHAGTCRLLGDVHPLAIERLMNLSLYLKDNGDIGEAQLAAEQALVTSRRARGVEHPTTQQAQQNLANILSAKGAHRQTLELYGQLLTMRTAVYGESHPLTLELLNDFAIAKQASGDSSGARNDLENVLKLSTQTVGPEDKRTLRARNNLAATLMEMGDLKGAQAQLETVVEAQERVFGAEVRQTLGALSNLSAVMRSLGDPHGALIYQARAVEAAARAGGPEDLDVLTMRAQMAVTMRELGMLTEALEHQRIIFETRSRIVGLDHPNTLNSLAQLALTVGEAGDLEQCQQYQERVLAGRTTSLGADHPHTYHVMRQLGQTLAARGACDRAKLVLSQALDGQKRTLGEHHPATLETETALASLARL